MPIVTQSRQIPPLVLKGNFKQTSGFTAAINSVATTGTQTTTSYRSNMSGVDRRAGIKESDFYGGKELRREAMDEYRFRYDNGHNFSTFKNEWDVPYTGGPTSSSISFRVRLVGGNLSTYSGWILPYQMGGVADFAIVNAPSVNTINKDGTSAINATIPTAPEAGLTQFLAELREGIPKLTGVIALKSGLNGKSVSEEYLNKEFGLRPFTKDLTDFVTSMLNANKIVKQYRRDSGRIVRRHTVLRESKSTTVVATSAGLPRPNVYSGIPFYFDGSYGCNAIDEVYDKVSFSGAYTYHLAEMDHLFSQLDRFEEQANHLLGTRITLDLIWELTPWSWLVDWFGNFGQIVQNVSLLSQDSTVLRYGYVMHETHAKRTWTQTGVRSAMGDSLPPIWMSSHTVRKTRTRATPYGFGVNVSLLSPRRWAILAALGMTKGANSLRLSD